MASLLHGDPSAGIEPLAGKVDLIYIDPPFGTGADFSFSTHVGIEEIAKQPSMLEHIAYRDTWGSGTDSYLQMLYDRLVLARDLLSNTGVIFLHIGQNVSHLGRMILDEVFGANRFINQFVWKRTFAHGDSGQGADHCGRLHDIVLLYSKSEVYNWNDMFSEYDRDYIESFYRHIEPGTGRRYALASTTGPGGAAKGNPQFEFLGVTRYWRFSKSRMEEMYDRGLIVQTGPGAVPRRKLYLDEAKGVPLQDLWLDIAPVQGVSGESTGFATQKPAKLLERVLELCSGPGDLVADFFLGSGTTAAVAHKLGRRWLGVDLGRFAIHTSRKRLLDLGATFDVLNLGKYERSHWQGVTLGDQLRAYLDFILSLYHAEPIPGFKHLHGVKAGRAVHVGAVDAPVTFDELEDVLAECRATSTRAVDILGWEWEMGVNQQIQQRAETYGVDLRLHQIPNDVMDRRAKAADVKFYSLAYIEAAIRHVQARTVQVELTDFIIPDLDLIPEAVRDKVKRWSDYIDYWAVDFDYGKDTLAPSEANVFRNGWQAFRTRARRTLDTTSATHTYDAPGTYAIAIKVVDVFGIDSTKCLEVTM